MQIVVQRGTGDNPGAEIGHVLLCTEEVILARGRQQLDYSAPNRMVVSPRCGSLEYQAPTVLVELRDAEKTRRGQLIYWSKSGTLTEREDAAEWSVECNLQVECLDEA